MDEINLGLWGAIVGSVVGVLGGVIGCYASLRNAQGPRERAFVVRGAVACAALVGSLLVALYFLPPQYRMLAWIPYLAALTLGIAWGNRTQAQIRDEESDARGS